MSRNGRHFPPRPRIAMRESAASSEAAAAIAAAIEQFLRDTAPAPAQHPQPSAWARAAMLRGVGAEFEDRASRWSDPQPWGR